MSILRDFERYETIDFDGPDTKTDDAASRRPRLAQNVIYDGKAVQTRAGIAPLVTVTPTLPPPGGAAVSKIRSLRYWLAADWDRLLFLVPGASPFVAFCDPGGTIRHDIATGLLASVTNMESASYGARFFMSLLDDTGKSVDDGRVWNGKFTGLVPQTDRLFQSPLSDAQVPSSYSEPGVGSVTAGDHRIAIVYVTRNGHETRAIEYGAIATATGGSNLRVTLTPVSTWPDWVHSVKILMTTTLNQSLFYFVPGLNPTPTTGTSLPLTLDIDIADETLTFATEGTDWFTLATSPEIGKMKFIGTYGNRVAYLVDKADAFTLGDVTNIVFSEPDDPQRVWLDRSIQFLPGKKTAVTGFQLYGTYYVLGPYWTYAFNDSGDYPVTWPAPEMVSESVGVVAAGCVSREVSKENAVQMVWVASPVGLFAFTGGSYSKLPASELQRDVWTRVNWKAPVWAYNLIDDQEEKRVRFFAPLDGASQATHVLSWDYEDGVGPTNVKFSLDQFRRDEGGNPVPLSAGGASIMRLADSRTTAVVIGDEEGPRIYRIKRTTDADPYDDDGHSIPGVYLGKPLVPQGPALWRLGGIHVDVEGSGTADLELLHFDRQAEETIAPIEMVPGVSTTKLRHAGLVSETARLRISSGRNPGDWFRLSRVVAYAKQWMRQR